MSEYAHLNPALKKLVDNGTMNADQALAAQKALLGTSSQLGRSRRSIISEAITYIGGAVIVVSAGLLLNQTWKQLGTWGRPAVIGAAAIALFLVALRLSKNVTEDTLRRLSSTLFVGSGALVAFTIGLITNEFWIPKREDNDIYWVNPKPWVVPTIAILCALGAGIVAWFGYGKVKSAFGAIAQITAADVFVFAVGALIWTSLYGDDDFPSFGSLALVIIGLFWIYVSEKKLLAEYNAVGVGAIITLFISLQTFRELLPVWAIPTIEIIGGLGLLAVYLMGRKWPFLAGGIGGLLMGGVELLTRYVEGVYGALGSMALGIALLILGTRLFREHQ